MNSENGQNPPAQPATDAARRRRRLLGLPRWIWIVFVLVGALIVICQGTNLVGDQAIANIATLVMVVLTAVALLVWFAFFSGQRRRTRMLVLASCLIGVASFFTLFRLDRLSGGLVPMFAYRFAKTPDQLLQRLPAEPPAGAVQPPVDLRTTTAHDFPQFLGPERTDSVAGVHLARDWTAHPPRRVWRQPIGAGWSGFSVVNGHAVTMEQRGDREMVTCYNVQTGRMEWAHANQARFETTVAGIGPRSTPTIDQGMVYSLGAMGLVQCLDGATGQLRWEHDLLKEFDISREEEAARVLHGRANSPLVVGDLVIVPAGGPVAGPRFSLVAYHKQDGTVAWQGGTRQVSYSSPAVATLAGVEQVLIVNEDFAGGHDLKTGKLLWEYPWPGRTGGDPNVSQAVALPPDRVFLSKAYGRGAALLQLRPQSDGTFAAEPVWTNRKVMKTKFTNVAIRDGYAYGLSDGVLECISLADGKSVWRDGRYEYGQLLRAGDLLLVMAEFGEMVLVEATPERANHVLGRFQALEGMTWNTFALAGPYLLVRNADEAACYELPRE